MVTVAFASKKFYKKRGKPYFLWLASEEFCRIKIGVGRPPAGEETADYVLSPFRKDEREVVDQALDHAVMALESCLLEGIEKAMNRFNVRATERAE